MKQCKSLILGSSSPQRRALMHSLGLRFEVRTPDIDERALSNETPRAFVERMALEKFRALHSNRPDTILLTADTVVTIDARIYGKPKNREHHIDMLERLAGQTHTVMTAVCLSDVSDTKPRFQVCAQTQVQVCALDALGIARYVDCGDGKDAAGGYSIQGLGAALIARIEGSYTNVVGLPLLETMRLLLDSGAVTEWP